MKNERAVPNATLKNNHAVPNVTLKSRRAELKNERGALKTKVVVAEIDHLGLTCVSMIVSGGSTPNVWNVSRIRRAALPLRVFQVLWRP